MHYHRNSVIGRPVQFVGLPPSEQSAHHAADQADWTANSTTVVVSTTPAATTGHMVVIELVAAAGTGVRGRDAFGQQRVMLKRVEEASPGIAARALPARDGGAGRLVELSIDPGV